MLGSDEGGIYNSSVSAKEITLTKPFEDQQLGGAVETVLARHKMERRLRETGEEPLDLILEVSGVAMWEWNVETGEVTTDRLWGRVLECPREEIGRDIPWWLEVIHPDDESVIRGSISGNLEGRIPSSEFEFRVRTRSGQWKWLLGRGRVMERDAGGKPVRVAGTVLDITDRKKAEAALKNN